MTGKSQSGVGGEGGGRVAVVVWGGAYSEWLDWEEQINKSYQHYRPILLSPI